MCLRTEGIRCGEFGWGDPVSMDFARLRGGMIHISARLCYSIGAVRYTILQSRWKTAMRYVLDEKLKLCGWKKLPFALVDTETKSTLFLRREQFEFLFRFSGKEDIDPDTLSEREKTMIGEMLNNRLIHPASDGETRDLFYKEYKGIYKKEVQWSITGKCNYRCKHCFQSAPEGVLGAPTKEQCLDIIRRSIISLRKRPFRHILTTSPSSKRTAAR